MKTIDMRFNSNILKQMIGKTFNKYRSDEFIFNNSLTGIVGIFVDAKIYEFRNEQKTVDYFGQQGDYAVFDISESSESEIKSFFDDTKQIDTPINQIIKKSLLLMKINNFLKMEFKHISFNLKMASNFFITSRKMEH